VSFPARPKANIVVADQVGAFRALARGYLLDG